VQPSDTPSPFAPYNPPPESPPPAAAPAEPTGDAGVQVMFAGDRRQFFNLVARGGLLQLITFGFYRFWLSTNVRRHLWGGTSVDGDTAEYTGTAIELLLGFLFALAILVPIYLLYFYIGLEAELYMAFASIPLFIFLFLFAQFAIYRARRYRMSRTVWRGVRFWMRGSGWDYAWRASLWLIPVVFTLGAMLPWRTAALERFKMGNSYYGNLPGRFEGSPNELFSLGWPFWAGTIGLFAVGWLFPPIIWIGMTFIYAMYKAIEWRWWIGGIRFGDVSFASNLSNTALIDLYWKVIGWTALIALVAGVAVSIVVAVAILASGIDLGSPEKIGASIVDRPVLTGVVIFIIAAFYIGILLAIGVVTQLYLTRDMWARVISSAYIFNLAAANNVIAEGDAANALGEGFADGLDVGGL
jgi:uncharacterized membrane protein YjgN (DUF898 family)